MSVAKNLNQNQLQQVEMRLCQLIMFTFIATSNTTWSTAHAYCIILWSLKISLARSAYVKTLAYTTGTICKHQRAMWPELYRKLIVFLRIVVWHIRVFSPFLHVWGYGAGCCVVIKCSKKCTSRPNFDNVTAKNWIGNVYFMLFLIAWFKSLSSLKHEFSIRLFDPAACYMLNNVC